MLHLYTANYYILRFWKQKCCKYFVSVVVILICQICSVFITDYFVWLFVIRYLTPTYFMIIGPENRYNRPELRTTLFDFQLPRNMLLAQWIHRSSRFSPITPGSWERLHNNVVFLSWKLTKLTPWNEPGRAPYLLFTSSPMIIKPFITHVPIAIKFEFDIALTSRRHTVFVEIVSYLRR